MQSLDIPLRALYNMYMLEMTLYAIRLTRAMAVNGLKNPDVAKASRTSQQVVSRARNAKSPKFISMDILVRIAKAAGMELYEMFLPFGQGRLDNVSGSHRDMILDMLRKSHAE